MQIDLTIEDQTARTQQGRVRLLLALRVRWSAADFAQEESHDLELAMADPDGQRRAHLMNLSGVRATASEPEFVQSLALTPQVEGPGRYQLMVLDDGQIVAAVPFNVVAGNAP